MSWNRIRSNSPISSKSLGQKKDFISSIIPNNEDERNLKLDDEFVKIMLDVEQRYTNMKKQEKIRIEQWTKKLCQVTFNSVWKKNRNNYAKELLQMVIQNNLREPFTKSPPETSLPSFKNIDFRPLKSSVNSHFEVQNQSIQPQIDRTLKKQQYSSEAAIRTMHHQNSENIQQKWQGIPENNYFNSINEVPPIPLQISHEYGSLISEPFKNSNMVSQQAKVDQNLKSNSSISQKSAGIGNMMEDLQRSLIDPGLRSIEKKMSSELYFLKKQLQECESKYYKQIQMQIEDIKVMKRHHEGEVYGFKQTIYQLQTEVSEKTKQISSLNENLLRLDQMIQQLGNEMTHLKGNQYQQKIEEIGRQIQQTCSSNQYQPIEKMNIYENEQISPIRYQEQMSKSTNQIAQPLNISIVNKNSMSPNLAQTASNEQKDLIASFSIEPHSQNRQSSEKKYRLQQPLSQFRERIMNGKSSPDGQTTASVLYQSSNFISQTHNQYQSQTENKTFSYPKQQNNELNNSKNLSPTNLSKSEIPQYIEQHEDKDFTAYIENFQKKTNILKEEVMQFQTAK